MDTQDASTPLVRLARRYVALVETLLISGMVGVVVLAALQVFFRYVVGMSLSWSEEALRYLMIWISSLGIGLAYSRGEMIGMGLLVGILPRRLGLVVSVAGRLIILMLMIMIAWYGWQFAWKTRGAGATAIPISMFWVHISIAFSSVLVALHIIVAFVELLTNKNPTQPKLSEVSQ